MKNAGEFPTRVRIKIRDGEHVLAFGLAVKDRFPGREVYVSLNKQREILILTAEMCWLADYRYSARAEKFLQGIRVKGFSFVLVKTSEN